jgi:hypothetical protein
MTVGLSRVPLQVNQPARVAEARARDVRDVEQELADVRVLAGVGAPLVIAPTARRCERSDDRGRQATGFSA